MPRIEHLTRQLRAARLYTVGLLDTIGPSDWFRMPGEGVTHVAWQVGHMAMAQYRLALLRVRGEKPDDDALISQAFLTSFGRESAPDPDPQAYPPPEEIRAIFDRVHQRVLAELSELPEEVLDEPPLLAHPLCSTRADALSWCASHELIHAGQIGLLRRLFGYRPVW